MTEPGLTPLHAGNIPEAAVLAAAIIDGWYPAGRIDWEDVWDRLDGATLADGTILDLPGSLVDEQLLALMRAARAESGRQ